VSLRRAHPPRREAKLPEDFFLEREWKLVNAWDEHDL